MKKMLMILGCCFAGCLFALPLFAFAADPLWFPHVACNGDWETEICILNPNSSQPLVGSLRAYRNDGAMASSARSVSLPPHGREQIVVGETMAEAQHIGYMVLEISSGAAVGYTKFYTEGRYRVAVPAVSKINVGDVGVPHIASNSEWWTGISLVNTTAAMKSLTFAFNDGTTVTQTLGPKEHAAFTVKSLFGGNTPVGIESAMIGNASGVIGLELFGSETGSAKSYLSGILLKDVTSTKLFYPHIASNENWWTGIVAFNPSEANVDLTITPYRLDGVPLSRQTISLNAYGKYIGTAAGLNFPAGTEWFAISASEPITGFELFGTNNGKQLAGYTGVNIVGKSGVFAKREMSWDGWTGIAFVNAENTAATVQLTAYDDGGNAVATQSIHLNAHEKRVGVAEALFDQSIDAATSIGYASDQYVVGFQLNGSHDEMMLDGLPGMAAESDGGDTVWYKDLDGDGYSDGVAAVSEIRPADYYRDYELIATSGDADDADPSVHPDSGGSSVGNYTGNQEFDLADAEQTDALYGFRTETPLGGAIPDRVDYSDKMPAVRDQGSTGSCTAWSTAYYYKTYHEVMEMGWDKNANAFSPMYLYSMQCRLSDEPWNFIRAWEVLNRYGCAKDATFPFQDLPDNDEKGQYAQVWISDAVNDEARNYRCGERTQLYDLNQVKQALTASPVLLGINNYDANLRSPSPENNYITYDPGNWNAGHAILCVGYDNSKFGVGALKFVNSWGSDWAIDGFSWLRYSDFSAIVLFAMTINDLPNAGGADSATSRPAAPADVQATDAAGPYVDVAWSRAVGAQYYRIYRARVGDSSTYGEIGSTYEPYFRDYPAPGIAYYYSVVSHNDIGSSVHYASDTDGKGYVDQGSARGASMAKPVVSWTGNEDALIRSNFNVSGIDASATAMEIFVGSASAGPWKSFGWIAPGSFYITWGEDSEYIGRKPFVKVLVSNVEGFSETSDPTQVGATIVGTTTIAAVASLTAVADGNDIRLDWTTDGGQADVFEVWRWLASEDTGGEWVLLDVLDGDARTYYDGAAAPGKYYYYAVGAGYQGAYGEYLILDDPVQVAVSTANLYLYEIYYDAGMIFNPAEFELTVWNDGGTVFSDYSIHINVYDFDDGEFYRPFEPFYASEVASGGQLPLYPGEYHSLQFGKYIPAAYGDGHYYAWIIWVDWYEEYDELYEDDNWIICDEGWWAYDWTLSALAGSSESATLKLKLESAPMRLMDIGQTASVGPVARPERTDKIRVSSRPFSAKTPVGAVLPGGFVRIPESSGSLMKSVGKTEPKAGPIRFKKPEFNVDHGK